jgi:hypothetical protein
MGMSGVADVEELLPFVQPAHHVALLTALCRADRMLDARDRVAEHRTALRKAARRTPILQACELMDDADEAASRGDVEVALELVARAIPLWPHYVCWFVRQPYTLEEVRHDPRLGAHIADARVEWARRAGAPGYDPTAGAAPTAYVGMELASARERGYVRPASHASWRSLSVQVLTVAGTLALLVWWTWRFFLAGG